MLGPLDPAQFRFVHTSRIRVMPKGFSGKWWLIVDMSALMANVNDSISESLSSLSYIVVNNAARGVHSFGQGSLFFNVRSTCRNMPIFN